MSGRKATNKVETGDHALAVGNPGTPGPVGWTWTKLNEISEMATGHTPSRRHPEYWGGGVKWMCAADARWNHGGVVTDTKETINELGLEKSAAVMLPKDTVCLARTGASIGYAVRLGEAMATNQGFVNWICGERLKPKFLQYLLVAEEAFLKRIAYGAAHHTIYFPEVKAFHLCMPPLPEQERIVAILDEAFEGIAKATAHAKRNLHNARELFQSVLQSTFEQKGEDWVETTLGEATGGVSTGPFGSLLHKKDYIENGIPLVNPAHITHTGIKPDYRKTVSQQTAERLASYALSEGDVVIGRRGEMGRCAAVTSIEEGWLCGTGSFFIRPSKHIIPEFLVSFLRSDDTRKRLDRIAGGATMKNLSNTALSKFPLSYPPVEKQKFIVEKLDVLSTETRQLEAIYRRKEEALTELKQSLLQKAFAGEL